MIDNTNFPKTGAPGETPINIKLQYNVAAIGNNIKKVQFLTTLIIFLVFSSVFGGIIFRLHHNYKKIKRKRGYSI